MNIRQSLSVGVGLAVILLFWFWAPLNLPLPAQRTLGLVLCTLLFWMTEPVPMEQASLLVLFLFPLTGLLSFEATFAGFATKAIWLIFAGMTLSLGITETALGKRLAFGLLQRLGSDYTRLILGLHLLGFFLAFLLPSGIIR
ncbi:MAG: SLC13 family permease, partial [Nitrospinota bacterium]